jgi:hypothetical protein
VAGSGKEDVLALEIARGNFLRAVEQVEVEDHAVVDDHAEPPTGKGRKVEVLHDLGQLLPTYLAMYGQGFKYVQNWLAVEVNVRKYHQSEPLNRLFEGLTAWRKKWNLLDPNDDPWIRNAAIKTLGYWAYQLQDLVNEGYGAWVLETFGLDLAPDGPAHGQELAKEIEAEPDPRGNRKRELAAHFREEQHHALELVGKRWWGIRVLGWQYPQGRNAKKAPSPQSWGYADEEETIRHLIGKATPPGMIRDKERGSDYNLRLLVQFQVKFKGMSKTEFALDQVDRNLPSVSRILRDTATIVGIRLQGKS